MNITFYDIAKTKTIATATLERDRTYIAERLREPTRFVTTLRTTEPLQLPIGTRTTYEGTDFFLLSEPRVRKINSQDFETEIELEEQLGLLKRIILSNPIDNRTIFDYTAPAHQHLQLIVDCLNKKFRPHGIQWQAVSSLSETNDKHIHYEGVTCFEALRLVADTYDTLFFGDRSAINLGSPKDAKENPLSLAYGKGKGLLSGAERVQYNDAPAPKTLYVIGAKRNLTKGRLTMTPNVYLRIDSGIIRRGTPDGRQGWYATSPDGLSLSEWHAPKGSLPSTTALLPEATYTNEDIYPSHVGKVSEVFKVGENFDVTDRDNTIDYETYLIAGETMRIVFQSGNLAGREFEVSYSHASKRFKLVQKEEDGTTLPNDTLKPQAGDKYIVLNIALPTEYIEEAQTKLTEEALRHLYKLSQQSYSYKLDIDPIFLLDNVSSVPPKLKVGRYVKLTDHHLAEGDPLIRIVGKRTYLINPHSPEIELSNEVSTKGVGDYIRDILGNLKQNETDKESLAKQLGHEIKQVKEAYTTAIEETEQAIAHDLQEAKSDLTLSIAGKVDNSKFYEELGKKASVVALEGVTKDVEEVNQTALNAHEFARTIKQDSLRIDKELERKITDTRMLVGRTNSRIDNSNLNISTISSAFDGLRLNVEKQERLRMGQGNRLGDIVAGKERTDWVAQGENTPYVSVIKEPEMHISELVSCSLTDRDVVSERGRRYDKTNSTSSFRFQVPDDQTLITISYDLSVGGMKYDDTCVVSLGGETLRAYQGGSEFEKLLVNTSYGQQEQWRLVAKSVAHDGQELQLYGYSGNVELTFRGTFVLSNLVVHLFKNSCQPMVTLTESGGRFYGDGLRYVDIDTRKTYQKKTYHPRYGDIYTDVPINSILTIRGGVNLDRLELSEGLDAVGAVLFGGWVNNDANIQRKIGLYANPKHEKRNTRVLFNFNTGVYTIYHYIGHNSYLPIVTPSENAWADSPRVLDMHSDYFTMAFFNNNNEQQKWRQRFTFICYKSV